MKKKSYLLLLIPILVFHCNCTAPSTKKNKINVIDVENDLYNFMIQPLSKHASEIRYVKLETNKNSLITESINNVFLEEGKIFVHDREPFLKVFDAITGKYLYNIGKKGQGPGELPYLSFVDINTQTKRILLSYINTTNEFDFQGKFIGSIQLPFISNTQRVYQNIVMVNDSLFASGIRSFNRTQEDAVIIFNRKGQIVNTLKSYKDPIQHPTITTWGPFTQGGIFYRHKYDIRYYRSISDTIYSYNESRKMFHSFISINFGKHNSTHNYTPGKENSDVIMLRNTITENSNSIFLIFYMKSSAPEPFEDKKWRETQFWNFINRDVYAIYSKEKNKLQFLLQPIPKIRGLKNDLDNGIPFWPKFISSTAEMVDFYQAYQFIENAQKTTKPDKSFLNFLNNINEDDNPIVIIATPL